MADWNTARGGNTERTLTAAAGPSPCDPYRQALTMRPSLKAPTFSFLNYYSRWSDARPVAPTSHDAKRRHQGTPEEATEERTQAGPQKGEPAKREKASLRKGRTTDKEWLATG